MNIFKQIIRDANARIDCEQEAWLRSFARYALRAEDRDGAKRARVKRAMHKAITGFYDFAMASTSASENLQRMAQFLESNTDAPLRD